MTPTVTALVAGNEPPSDSPLARTFAGVTLQHAVLFLAAIALAGLNEQHVWRVVLGEGSLTEALGLYGVAIAKRIAWFAPPVLATVAAVNVSRGVPRRLAWSLPAAVIVGSAAGRLLWHAILLVTVPGYRPPPLPMIAAGALSGLMFAGLFALIYVFLDREAQALRAFHQVELDRIVRERVLAESRMLVMQAQIEPHFIFNSLANLRRLNEIDRRRGRSMLRSLMRYLTAALPKFRDSHSTLGRELVLAEAYLKIAQIRMGPRLVFAIDVPASLTVQPFPSLTIVTLVENAIKHGVGPLPEGGLVRIAARAHGERLLVEVSDNGRGLAESGGAGVGLANIRARLAAAYAKDARVKLAQNSPRGVIATIEIPMSAPPAMRAAAPS